jgi:hypothetical protein
MRQNACISHANVRTTASRMARNIRRSSSSR